MRATVVANPQAGKGIMGDQLAVTAGVLERNGWSLDVRESAARGEVTAIARAAVAKGQDAVLVAGGDGSLNEAVQALAGTQTALGYLPYGTVNIWARETGIPLDPERAARAIVEGRTAAVDLGIANDRYFLLMAGMGFDGEVVRRARRLEHYKHRFGILPYAAAGLTTAAVYRGADVELRYDGIIRRVQALMLVVGNTRLYGGRFHLTPNAVANDGWLDLCIVKGKGPVALVRQALPVLLLGSTSRSDVECLRVRELTVGGSEPIAYQLDGELGGETPVRFRVAPRALRVILPKDFASDLIA